MQTKTKENEVLKQHLANAENRLEKVLIEMNIEEKLNKYELQMNILVEENEKMRKINEGVDK